MALSRTALVLTALVLIIPSIVLATAVPVHASSITITPSSGTTSTNVHIEGNGFSGGVATIYWDDQPTLNKIPISQNGELDFDFQVPTDSKGNHTIRISDDSNWTDSTAIATFTILPTISIFPTIGRPYSTIIVTGTGFGRLEKDIRITVDKYVVPTPITANYMGAWSANIDAPGPDKGEHNISAFSSAITTSEVGDFKFIAGPFAKIEPSSGKSGTEVAIEGYGFRTSEDGITITWDNEIIFCNFIAGFNGVMNTTFITPPATQGHHLVGLFGSDFTPRGVIPDMDFNVIPNIELQPASGNKGTKVMVSGTGFAKGETINLSFEDASLNVNAITDDTGSFSTNFVSPQSTIKENRVKAVGTAGNSAETVFGIQRIIPPAPTLLHPVPGDTIEAFDSVGAVFLGAAKQLFSFMSVDNTRHSVLGLSNETFQWSNSSSHGKMTYSLEIANNNDFSSPAIVKEGLTGTQYTLSSSEILNIGSHSWRVRVTDEIGNVGSWSEAQQFEVISMSNTVLILSLVIPLLFIVAAAALLIILWRRYRATY